MYFLGIEICLAKEPEKVTGRKTVKKVKLKQALKMLGIVLLLVLLGTIYFSYYLDSENSDTNPPVKEFREQYSIEEVPTILCFQNEDCIHIHIDITNSKFGGESLTEALQEYTE